MPIDPISAGTDFASRLAANVYGLHKQDTDQARVDAERQRTSMLNVLETAAQSGNVNPEDMPALYSKMFELNGASSKEIAALTPHLQAAFSQATPRTVTTQMPVISSSVDQFGSPTQSFQLPSVPTPETINAPAIRLMSPEEKGARAAQIQADTMRTTYAQRQKELDDANRRKLELQGAALSAKEQSKLNEIITKGGIDAEKKFNERVNAFLPQTGYDAEAARGLASKSLIRDEEAAAGAKEAQAKVSAARVNYLAGQLAVHQKNADTLSRRVDAYVSSVAETARKNRASESAGTSSKGGGAVGRNLKVLQANTKELYTALTPLNNAIVKLETDPLNKESDGTLIAEVKTQVDDLKARRDAIQSKLDTFRQTWLPSMPEPTTGVVPPVPQASGRGAAQPKGIIRRSNLGAVRTQNPSLAGLDDNSLVQYLSLHGYTVK